MGFLHERKSGRPKDSVVRGISHLLGSSFMAMKKSNAMSRALAKGSSRSREPGLASSASHLLRAVQRSFRSATPSPLLSTCTALCCDRWSAGLPMMCHCMRLLARLHVPRPRLSEERSLNLINPSGSSSKLSSMMQSFRDCDLPVHDLCTCAADLNDAKCSFSVACKLQQDRQHRRGSIA